MQLAFLLYVIVRRAELSLSLSLLPSGGESENGYLRGADFSVMLVS